MAGTTPRGWYVISLRPQGEHAALRRAVARHGGGVLALSPWRLQGRQDAATRQALAAALEATAVVFTSPAAVRFATRLQGLHAHPGQAWIGVGGGTALALRRAGIAGALAPARMDSEGVLALPALGAVEGAPIGLVTAPQGRGMIAAALSARGARLRTAEVYARVPVAPAPAALARLRALDAPACLALSSAAALDAVLAALPADLADALRDAPVLAASERLAAHAAHAGFGHVHRAAGPRPAQLAAAAWELCSHRFG